MWTPNRARPSAHLTGIVALILTEAMNFGFFGTKTTVRIKRYVHSVEVIEGFLYYYLKASLKKQLHVPPEQKAQPSYLNELTAGFKLLKGTALA